MSVVKKPKAKAKVVKQNTIYVISGPGWDNESRFYTKAELKDIECQVDDSDIIEEYKLVKRYKMVYPAPKMVEI